MANEEEGMCAHFVFNFTSLPLMIFACIFILVQSILNVIFNSNNKTCVAERLVYQQFSHDVYSNIKSKILYDFEIIEYDQNCSDNREILNIPIKIDSFYDCEKVKVDDIDKDLCQNKISRTSTCCKKECCKLDIYTNQKICRNKNIYNLADISEDPRKKCKLFNIYNGKLYKIDNYKICARRYDYNYEYLLGKNEKSFCPGGIILDSLDHCLNENITILNQSKSNVYLSFKENSSVIVKNILSEINPNFFEYELLLKESILNNKIKINEKEQNIVNKYKVINIKNINDAFFKNIKNLGITDGNSNYINHFSRNINNLMNGNDDDQVFNEFQDNYFIKNKSLNWYTRNYIGFKDINELKKFKYYFDEDDPTNNPLYKMDKLLFPNAESIVISSIFIILLASNLYGQIYYYKNNELDEQKSFYLDSFRRISTLVLFIIYLSIYLFKYLYYYHKIEEIEMEKYYAIVLEKYNKRRRQIYLLIGVILLGLNLIIEIIHYIIEYKQNKEPVTQGTNNPSNKTIICELEYNELGKKRKIKFKFYLKRKFSEEKERFEKKFFRNYDIIECKLNNEVIDEDKTISALKLERDSIIEVICEPIEKEVKVGNDISNE
jgi:hypothetical protein